MGSKEKAAHGYVERLLSWMYFNRRILQEAAKSSVPVLERMSFLGIYSNNLDEFFRVRVASLSRIAESGDKSLKDSRERARKTIKEINRLNAAYNKMFERTVTAVTGELEAHGIRVLRETELNDEQQAYVRRLYTDRLNGQTNPVWLSEVKELGGTTADDGIWLGVKRTSWRDGHKKPHADYALIKVPSRQTGRFVELPPSDGYSNIMYIDDVIRFCLPLIFIGSAGCSFEAYSFKFTKDAEMEMDNDLDYGVLQKVARGVKSRRRDRFIHVPYHSFSSFIRLLREAALSPLTCRERIDRYALKPDRADVIVPAATIFLTVADALGCRNIRVPNVSLADSIIAELGKDILTAG